MTLLVLGFPLSSCSDFVEVDPPKNTLIAETVFKDPATVESALANLYYSMRERGMVSGSFGLSTALGIYADELDYYGSNADQSQLYNHTLLPSNNLVLEWWSEAYHLIYGANDIIKGVEGSDELTKEEKSIYKGQALFVRAYMHSLLVSLYGDVPYITTTDYEDNNKVSRTDESEVYKKLIVDLEEAMVLMEAVGRVSEERIIPDHHVAKALLARIYLYMEDWEGSASMATELIDSFTLESDLDRVFLKDSPETLWQLKPDDGENTSVAPLLIIPSVPGQTYALTPTLLESFEDGDLRFEHWIDSISDTDGTMTFFYTHKYKADLNETESLEYSILFRLAEQFLIRAEARAHSGDILGAQQDLNAIRNRAGLPDTLANTVESLLDAIHRERQVELFTELGHRLFDLRRTGLADETLRTLKPNWRETDLLFPIPEDELEINPNLLPQNPGY
jgi:hypothetical protein